MKNNNLPSRSLSGSLIIILVIISLSSIGLGIYSILSRPKTGFVDITKLYDSFVYKKELEVDFKNVQAKRKEILDSLKLDYEIFVRQNEASLSSSNSPASKHAQILRDQYLLKKEQFDQDNATLSNQYSQQILNQLNQYVMEYGKENSYFYIFGANSNGTLMYASENENITDKVAVYINSKYQGKLK